MTPSTVRIRANGLEFVCRSCGDGPLLLCLHGFPDSAHSFEQLLPVLAAAGYRVVAPNLRGYAPTGIPADGDYRMSTLAEDVLALADALDAPRFSLLGHDWGAVASYATAALAPERVQQMICCAVPHPRRFLTGLSLPQLRRSWYMAYFQLPSRPDWQLARGGMVERLWRDWSPDWHWTAEDLAIVKRALADPEHIRAALGYYRALPGQLVRPALAPTRRKLLGYTRVPTLAIAGGRDGCIGPEIFNGQQRFFSAGYEFQLMPTAGHFMHREQPVDFVERVIEFLRRDRNQPVTPPR